MTDKREIYLVDDSADHRFLIRTIFDKYLTNYTIRFFDKGQDLYQHLILISSDTYKGRLPGLLLLDLNMPGIDGYNLLRLIRQRLNNKHIPWKTLPVVILTSQASDEQINNCYEAGVSSLLIKPLDFEELHELLGIVCRYWLDLNQVS